MPIHLYDRFHTYLVIALVFGGLAMMVTAWIWDSL